jgi:ribosomal protein S18 acetylase RimI-like enzyme
MIYHLCVAPSHRRRGVATRLVQATFAGLRSAGIEQCYAMAYTNNELAHSFWKRLGSVLRTDLNLFRTPVSPP